MQTTLLRFSAGFWLTITTIGQWIFGIYITLFYGKSTLEGDFERWNRVLPHGYVAGDWKGNLIVGTHVLLAAVLVFGGPLQLIPMVRGKFPQFHRWLGRIYVITAVVTSLAGLIMVWTRGTVGDMVQHLSISVQAIYILAFAFLTIRHAWMGRFGEHRKWALRLFMVVSGVWFFRVQLMAWLLIHGGPAGFDPDTFTGPFLTALSIFTYVLPLSLIVLELYFLASQKSAKWQLAASVGILSISLLMAAGIFAATMGMWLPRI